MRAHPRVRVRHARGHRVHLVVVHPDGTLRNQLSPYIRLVGLKSGLLRLLPVFRRYVLSLNRWSDLANAFAVVTEDDLYRQMLRIPEDPAAVVLGARERPDLLQDATAGAALSDFMERIGFLDMMTRLPDGILTKVDRASMVFGLEVRVPLLDHRVVEYVWRLVPALKYAGAGENKRLLRLILYRHVPRTLVDRQKSGFTVPIKVWLRGPLRAWAEELLGERSLAEDGFFNPTLIRARWREHLAGTHNRQRLLWHVLMFQQWRRHQAAESAISNGCLRNICAQSVGTP